MNKSIVLNLLWIAVLMVAGISAEAQTAAESMIKLNGKHDFENAKAKSWVVSQELIDEKTGESVIKEDFVSAKGSKAKFDLLKVKDKETIYYVTASGDDFEKKYDVRVFEPGKISSFIYKSELNPDVRTYVFLPKTLSEKSRVMLVMHGLSRNADDYIAAWEKWAGKNDYVVIAPNFDNDKWKGARMYNLGNMFTTKDLKVRRSKWSFTIVEDLFSMFHRGFGLKQPYFDMFGHSAGAQFVHRFMLFMPKAKVRVAVSANAGWYTIPDLDLEFPYGLKHGRLSLTAGDLINWSNRNVFILRGTDDTLRTDNLQKTPEADAQGQNRFERAGFMFEKIKALNPNTNWRLIDAPKVGHDQKRMATAAQMVLDIVNDQSKGS